MDIKTIVAVAQNGKSNSWYVQITLDGKRRKIYGFRTKDLPRKFADNLEELRVAANMLIRFFGGVLWKNCGTGNPDLLIARNMKVVESQKTMPIGF